MRPTDYLSASTLRLMVDIARPHGAPLVAGRLRLDLMRASIDERSLARYEKFAADVLVDAGLARWVVVESGVGRHRSWLVGADEDLHHFGRINDPTRVDATEG